MFKEYKDERINNLIKKSFECAVRDDEWNDRHLEEWNILFDDIDKILKFVDNGYKGELKVDENMWYILQDTLCGVMKLYGLKFASDVKVVGEYSVVVPIKKFGAIKEKIYNKMIQYGWNLGNNDLMNFDKVYDLHYNFIEDTFDFISEDDYDFSMQDISKEKFGSMIDFISDFLRALDEIDREER